MFTRSLFRFNLCLNLSQILVANLGAKWNIWMEDVEIFILVSGIINAKRKRALLLYQPGQRIREIFRQIPDTGTDGDYKLIQSKRSSQRIF